jgi:hypothetical protein
VSSQQTDPNEDFSKVNPPITEAATRLRSISREEAESDDEFDLPTEVERLYRNADEVRQMFDRQFAELPIMKQLLEKWEERGLKRNDPAIILIETLGLYDERQKSLLKQLSGVIDATNRTHLMTTRGVAERMDEMVRLEKSLRVGLMRIQEMNDGWEEMEQYFRSFREHVPYMIEQILAATRTINDKSIKGAIFNWVTPTLALVTGVIIGLWLKLSFAGLILVDSAKLAPVFDFFMKLAS